MLRIDLEQVCSRIETYDGLRLTGKLRLTEQGLACQLPAAIGDQCQIVASKSRVINAEVIGFTRGLANLMPYEPADSVQAGVPVVHSRRRRTVPVGDGVLGRILDGLGRPLDTGGSLEFCETREVRQPAPSAFVRVRIHEPLVTGQKAIDGMLTTGRGQRMGIFAGSGVGKSTLMGQIAKGSDADVNVIALVGERGCELRPFIEDCLGEAGIERSAIVISTCDQPPMMRIQAVETAITVADHFREQGKHVLFFLDSLTRLAMAQREMGLSIGEPPSARGYTPSVFQLMARTLERLGNGSAGSITGFLTVLVDGDDLDEPVSDAARALLDGHIVLARRIAEKGQFPAISVGQSVSRAFLSITESPHQASARKIREIMTTYSEVEDLIRIGAYTKGTNPQVDRVIDLMPAVTKFLRQEVGERFSFQETRQAMDRIAASWPY